MHQTFCDACDSDVLNHETTPAPIHPDAYMPQPISDWKTQNEFEPTNYDIWMMEDRSPSFVLTRVVADNSDSSSDEDCEIL